MLVLNPRNVKFGAVEWKNVVAVAVDRQAARTIEEIGDVGPYVTFADVPQQRVRIRVQQEFTRDEMSAPRPGDQATLEFITTPAANEMQRRKVTATAVVLSVDHELSQRRGAIRRIELTALSSNGTADPVVIVDG